MNLSGNSLAQCFKELDSYTEEYELILNDKKTILEDLNNTFP